VPEGSIPGVESNIFSRFMANSFHRNWELYPLWMCLAVWCVFFTGITYATFSKWEIWIDRSKKLPPFDWERDGVDGKCVADARALLVAKVRQAPLDLLERRERQGGQRLQQARAHPGGAPGALPRRPSTTSSCSRR